MTTIIDSTIIAKIAKLARLRVPPEEQPVVAEKLNNILNWIAQLDEVDVTNVEPLANVNDGFLRMRKDVVNDGNKAEDILANAPSATADFFTVPKVIE
jgi:aspartyl-tRNA(Asn)/glutamyl-tRNA(Gln) amidotransferase subunit C